MSDHYESLQDVENTFQSAPNATQNTNNTSNTTTKPKSKIVKFLAYGTATLTAVAAVGFIVAHLGNSHESTNTTNTNGSNQVVKNTTATQTPSTFDKLTHFLDKNQASENVAQAHYDAYVNPHSPLVKDAKHLQELKEAGNFNVAKGLSASQLGVAVAKAQVQKGDDFLFSAMTSYTEGIAQKFVPDNQGYEVLCGINTLFQGRQTLTNVFGTFEQDKNKVNIVANQAGRKDLTSDAGSVSFTPQQAAIANMVLEPIYQKPVMGILTEAVRNNVNAMRHVSQDHISPEKMAQQIWDEMPVNQQKVFTYMDYNLGSGNLSKFKNMWKAVVDRHFTSDEFKQNMTNLISDHINITYKINVGGQVQVVENTRENTILKTAFQSKEAFGYLVGNNPAPSNFASIAPSIVSYNKGIPADGSTIKIQDKVADVLAQAAAQGQTVTIDQDLDTSSYTTYNDPINLNDNGLANKIKAMRDKVKSQPVKPHKSFAGMF